MNVRGGSGGIWRGSVFCHTESVNFEKKIRLREGTISGMVKGQASTSC